VSWSFGGAGGGRRGFDLTIKPGDEFTRSTEVGRPMASAPQLPALRPKDPRRGFVPDEPRPRWVEIDVELGGS
jgi:hypothetical protein